MVDGDNATVDSLATPFCWEAVKSSEIVCCLVEGALSLAEDFRFRSSALVASRAGLAFEEFCMEEGDAVGTVWIKSGSHEDGPKHLQLVVLAESEVEVADELSVAFPS